MCVCVCVVCVWCVCVCGVCGVCVGALVVQLVESWAYNPEDTGSNPRAGGKKHHKYSSPPICKMGTWWGAKYTGCVSLVVTKGVGGTLGAHTCSERHSWCSCEFLARLQEIAQHRHTLPAWCTGALASPGTCDPCGS